MKLSIIYLSALLVECIHAASVPIIYCVNEAASADDCGPEAFQAAESTKDWFESYMSTHTNRKEDRRHLLDCSRFCNTDEKYFTIHYPCDCEKDRRMTVVEISNQIRNLYDPLVGPIQLFKSFAAQLPEGKCRTILELSRCIVTFVDKYDNDFSKLEDETTDETPSDVYLNELYNVQTGKLELYHADTGDIVTPENVTSNNDDDSMEEIYDPISKTYKKVDVEGKYITEEGKTPPTSGVDGDEVFDEEIYDPVSNTYHKVDPSTGEYIN